MGWVGPWHPSSFEVKEIHRIWEAGRRTFVPAPRKEASDRVYADDCAACIAIVARGYGDVNCSGTCGFGAARMLSAAAASRATKAR